MSEEDAIGNKVEGEQRANRNQAAITDAPYVSESAHDSTEK